MLNSGISGSSNSIFTVSSLVNSAFSNSANENKATCLTGSSTVGFDSNEFSISNSISSANTNLKGSSVTSETVDSVMISASATTAGISSTTTTATGAAGASPKMNTAAGAGVSFTALSGSNVAISFAAKPVAITFTQISSPSCSSLP